MFELAGIAVLIAAAFAVFLAFSLIGLVLKLAFKVVLLPLVLVGWILKGVLLLLALVVGLIVAPVAFLALAVLAVVVGIPLLLLFGLTALFGAGWALA